MAVPEQTPYKEYTANGVTTSFPLEFDCENQDHLIVTVNDIEPENGQWSFINGAVVFLIAPANQAKIVIQRNTPLERNTNYQTTNNSFRPQPVNKDFDRIWWKLQELWVQVTLLWAALNSKVAALWVALNQEIQDRINGDKNLNDKIILEVQNRINADADLNNKINLEALSRINSDNYINLRINNEISDRIEGDNNALTSANTYTKNYVADIVNSVAQGGSASTDLLLSTWSGRVQREKNKDIISAYDFGAKGDGIFNDGLAVENALKNGSVLFVKDTIYDLGGREILIKNSLNITIQKNVVFKNGFLRLIPTDNQKRVIINGDINLGVNCSLRIGGLITPSTVGDNTDPYEHDPASVTVLCNDIRAISQFAGTTTTVNITSYDNSQIGNISVICGDDLYDVAGVKKVNPVSVYLGNGYDSVLGNIFTDGVFTMGVHIDSSSVRSAFSMCRCKVGNIESYKKVGDVSGQHGVYFHGAFETNLGIVRGSGWGLTISSSADFKFRDNMNCTVDVVDVDRFRITSDANYIWFDNYARNNTFKRVTAKYFATVVSFGQLENNYFLESDIDQCALNSNNGNERGIIFSGRTVIGAVDGVINVSAAIFENARVSWKNNVTPDLIGAFFNATESKFYNDVNYRPTTASTTKLNNVQFFKKFNHEPTSAPDVPKAHTSVMNQVDVYEDLLIKTFSGNTHSANWRFVNCGVNAPNSGRQPTTKKYRFVSYNDANYPTLNS